MVEFSRRQTGDVMSACDPAFRPTNNSTDNGSFQGTLFISAKDPVEIWCGLSIHVN